ncbi:MAG: class I SAM-dependent methyltransferase [Alphaproteobacteria bacterium]|nr:class I SAM-dependent methyltransferase [Alphaproteobacteria bacterium]
MTTEDGWDQAWDTVFSAREWGRYPPEDLVRFIARSYGGSTDRRQVRILELGCGPGANLWYLAREGFQVYGVDGSAVAIDRAGQRLAAEGLSADLRVGDVARIAASYPPDSFDAIIDIACLQHAALDVRTVLDQAHALLRRGGQMFAMMIAHGSWGEGLGRKIAPGTYTDVPEGPWIGVGRVHFFTLEEVRAAFSAFEGLRVEELCVTVNNRRAKIHHWLAYARKL